MWSVRRASARGLLGTRTIKNLHNAVLAVSVFASLVLVASGDNARPAERFDSSGRSGRQNAVNIALHKPCMPTPGCSKFVDGRFDNVHEGPRRGKINSTGLNVEYDDNFSRPDSEAKEAESSSSNDSLLVFLQERHYITQVVVICESLRGGTESTVGPPQHLLVVTTWELEPNAFDSSLEAGSTKARVQQQEVVASSADGDKMRISFAVNDEISVVGVSLDLARPDSKCIGCSRFRIVQVLVLEPTSEDVSIQPFGNKLAPQTGRRLEPPKSSGSKPAHEEITELPTQTTLISDHVSPMEANALPARELVGATVSLTASRVKTAALWADGSMKHKREYTQNTRAYSSADVVKVTDEMPDAPNGNVQGFLAPTFDGRSDSFAYYHIVAVIAFLAIGAFFLPRVCVPKVLDGVDYARIPEVDAEAPPAQSGGGFATTVLGFVSSQPHTQSPPQTFHIGTPRGSRPSSPAPPLCHSRSSESEPEGELEPRSSSSSPRGVVLAPVPVQQLIENISAENFESVLELAPTRLGQIEVAETNFVRVVDPLVLVLYASPLCHVDQRGGRKPLPQIAFDREWDVVVKAHDQAGAQLRSIARRQTWRVSLEAQPLTANSLRVSLASCGSKVSVLHLSAHGSQDHLVVDDGKGTAHLLSCSQVAQMLELRREILGPSHSALRLVVLNVCSLQKIGSEFVRLGVPHVICSSSELRDSASHAFMRALYSSLFQGSTVSQAFSAALVAIRSDPEMSTRAQAESFYLLPEGAPHDEVLFQIEQIPATSARQDLASARGALSKAVNAAMNFPPFSSSTGSSAVTVADNTGSSTDGFEDSCNSEGGVDSASSRGPVESSGSDSEDIGSGAEATEDTHLLSREANTIGKATPVGASARKRTGNQRPAMTAAWSSRSLGYGRSRPRLLPSPPPPLVASKSVVSLLGRSIPAVPEDFIGRTMDVWSVLQLLGCRRAVVVCGAQNTEPGIGKSALLNAVHRTIALQLGGVCAAVHLRSLAGADEPGVSAAGWIDKVRDGVRQASREYQELWWPSLGGQSQRRSGSEPLSAFRQRRVARSSVASRAVSSGFHPLSDPIAVEWKVHELVAEMTILADLYEARCRERPMSYNGIVLLLDECDHLIQQEHFQAVLADVLQTCSAYRVVLSTHQRMVGTAGGQFKVVHHELHGLHGNHGHDATRLFLRRVQRPLRWEELVAEGGATELCVASAMEMACVEDLQSLVRLGRSSAADLATLNLLASHPLVAAQCGNPRRLIELASRLGPAERSFKDLDLHTDDTRRIKSSPSVLETATDVAKPKSC